MAELHPWIERLDDRTVLVAFPAARSPDEIRAFWSAMDRLCEEGRFPERFGVVFDLTRMTSTDPRGRALMLEHIRSHDAFYRAHCVGLAVVLRSRLLRNVAAMMSRLIADKPAPVQTVDSVAAGRAWLARAS